MLLRAVAVSFLWVATLAAAGEASGLGAQRVAPPKIVKRVEPGAASAGVDP